MLPFVDKTILVRLRTLCFSDIIEKKDMDKVETQYALESTSQPLGISGYELSKLIPEEFRGSMPTIEEIEVELNE